MSLSTRPTEPGADDDDDGSDDSDKKKTGHSRDAHSASTITPHALFVNYLSSSTSSRQEHIDPEFYPRPDGTVYVCGISEAPQVPSEVPEAITTDERAVGSVSHISTHSRWLLRILTTIRD